MIPIFGFWCSYIPSRSPSQIHPYWTLHLYHLTDAWCAWNSEFLAKLTSSSSSRIPGVQARLVGWKHMDGMHDRDLGRCHFYRPCKSPCRWAAPYRHLQIWPLRTSFPIPGGRLAAEKKISVARQTLGILKRLKLHVIYISYMSSKPLGFQLKTNLSLRIQSPSRIQ